MQLGEGVEAVVAAVVAAVGVEHNGNRSTVRGVYVSFSISTPAQHYIQHIYLEGYWQSTIVSRAGLGLQRRATCTCRARTARLSMEGTGSL